MRTFGLIFPVAPLAAGFRIAGLSLPEREARALRRAGCDRVVVVGDAEPPSGVSRLTAAGMAALLEPGDRVLAIASGLILDERALAALVGSDAPALLVADATRPGARGVERLDALTYATGALLATAAQFDVVVRSLGDWDLGSTLIRTVAADSRTRRLEFAALPLYDPARRRDVPMLWLRPASPEAARDAGAVIVAAAQKGCLDWPARYLYPAVENALVNLLLPAPVTGTMVRLANLIAGTAALVGFATGWLWTGLLLALVCGLLDGVENKLARVRLEVSLPGTFDQVYDKLMEYGWYLAAAGHFAAVSGGLLPFAIAALIILPAAVHTAQAAFFRRFTGIELVDAGRIERRIRLFAGRRNTFLWAWLPFAVAGWWFGGFALLAAYSVATTAAGLWRFYVRLGEFGRAHSAIITANFASAHDIFLSSGGS